MRLRCNLQILICVFLAFCSRQLSAQELGADTKAKIAERDQLVVQATDAVTSGKLDEATTLFERVYMLEQSIFGDTHEALSDTLEQLSQLATARQDDTALVRYRERQLAIANTQYGSDDYRTQDAVRAVNDAKQMAMFTPEQKAQFAQSVSLASQMEQAYQAGNYPEAIRAANESLDNFKLVLGEHHPDYALCLNNLAFLYAATGKYPQAEPLYREAIQIQEIQLGKWHPDYALSLGNLAALYETMGDYPSAEPLHCEALMIWEKTLGKQHLSYATSLNNLAFLYTSLGDYVRAEPLYREALAIIETALGKQHPNYAGSVNNLATLYDFMGDYVRAEPLYREATAILEKVVGKQHPDYATSLNNLAHLYTSMRDYLQAEPLYLEALGIQEIVWGKQHPSYALSLNNLATFYQTMQNYPQAESLYREALAIREKVIGKQHPDYASSLNSLAVLYSSIGDYSRAEPLFRASLEIREKVPGKQHPVYALCLNNLAAMYESMGEHDQAEPLYREAAEITLGNLKLTADVQSLRQQVVMGESLRYQLDSYLSQATRASRFQADAYATLLRWKGNVWQRQQQQRLLLDQPSLKTHFAALSEVSSKLSALILRVPDPQHREAWHRQLAELTNQREHLERDLSLASVEFQQTTTLVTPEQLRASLPPGTMLVDYLEYDHFTRESQEQQTKQSVERHLLVHLVRADQEVRAINLGAVEPLNELVQTWRQDFGQSLASAEAAKKLRQRIWEPLGESLDGITTVYVSPDGLLGQFPLAALPSRDPQKYLLEELAIVMLPVPQGLPAITAESPQPDRSMIDRFCLVGGVNYDQVASPEELSLSEMGPAPLMLAARGSVHEQYKPLSGTLTEIEAIESLIRQYHPAAQTTILRGSLASESAFAGLAPGHRYLHIATHGFFAPESVKNALTASSHETVNIPGSNDSRFPKIVGQHPDVLSGLVFAGANQLSGAGADDGILTAAEVQSLDLRGVDLAVLSACETGLGKSAGGQGIIGLQRAFQLSGARTTITSLWQVDDAATQALMVEFYRNLFERKLSKLESLRQAQIWMLNHPDAIEGKDLSSRGDTRKVKPLEPETPTPKSTRSLPEYWAAFQLSGDPR